ncbi:MAG: hypothetical protein QM638_07175 [Nocardioides sp.]|uniref:hypothetical protein n=1 Tax=Nocardioides sp. TaxID=35761 RepID=UPI0039E34E0F
MRVALRLGAALGAAATVLAALMMPAAAIPPGGASNDTPGTSASSSPKTLHAGDTISFRVTGFPAGQVVYVKIDDGKFCAAAATHGACVVHQQVIGSGGSVSGSFVLPSDLKPGKHWLRFLASEPISGAGGGTKGYTARGNSDFTTVAGGSDDAGSDTGSTDTDSATSTETSTASSSATSTVTDSTDSTGAGSAAPSVAAAGSVLEAPAPSGSSSADTSSAGASATASAGGASASETATATDATAVSESSAADDSASHFPVAGTIGVVVLAAIALGLALRARRARS